MSEGSEKDIETAEEYAIALAEIEELWIAPIGKLDVPRLIILRRRVREYESKDKTIAASDPASHDSADPASHDDGSYDDERFCGHCERVTRHRCHDSGHERDSSGDTQECLTCNWYCGGIAGQYFPPIDPTSPV